MSFCPEALAKHIIKADVLINDLVALVVDYCRPLALPPIYHIYSKQEQQRRRRPEQTIQRQYLTQQFGLPETNIHCIAGGPFMGRNRVRNHIRALQTHLDSLQSDQPCIVMEDRFRFHSNLPTIYDQFRSFLNQRSNSGCWQVLLLVTAAEPLTSAQFISMSEVESLYQLRPRHKNFTNAIPARAYMVHPNYCRQLIAHLQSTLDYPNSRDMTNSDGGGEAEPNGNESYLSWYAFLPALGFISTSDRHPTS
jgi:hypothetical protein